MARPIRRPAPVTSATWPSSGFTARMYLPSGHRGTISRAQHTTPEHFNRAATKTRIDLALTRRPDETGLARYSRSPGRRGADLRGHADQNVTERVRRGHPR